MTDRPSQTGLSRHIPGIGVLRTYERSWLRFDLIAGVVLAAILVPQGMAYAELAGLPTVTGLYTTIACLVGYALMGPSRVLVLGPDSSVSPLIFAAIFPLVAVTDDPATAIALAGMMALMVGLILIGLGLGKLGFVADLLSKEVQVGYMNGLAITIIVGQLPKLFGFSTDADGFIEEVRTFFTGVDGRNTTALAVGLATLAVLLLLPRVTRTIPAVLVAVVGATVVTAVFDLDISTVGALPQGLPRPSVPWTTWDDIAPMFVAAIGITLVSLTDTIATSTAFAARRGEEVDPNQEMIGIGTANITAGFFQGFAVSTSGSRTAVAESSGAKSQLTGLVGALDGGVAAPVLQHVARRSAADGVGRRRHRRRSVAWPISPRCVTTYECVRVRSSCRWSPREGRVLRGAAGHPDRRRPVRPAVLQAQLVAAR